MASTLAFCVRRREPILVTPATPTPHELKHLSDIDDQQSLRCHVSNVHFYRSKPSMRGRDPARAVREALAKALVFYYPLAGRLREGIGQKLMVECTGQGVLFMEADADAKLDQLSDADFLPPVRCLEELLYDVPGSQGILDCPLMLFQVTRFACGGFSLAFRVNHTLFDAAGVVQFIKAVGEMARGAAAPAVGPVWARELLTARTPPHITCTHPEYDEVPSQKAMAPLPDDDLIHCTFLFGSQELTALREQLHPQLRTSATSFDLISACLWRSRTIALGLCSDEVTRFYMQVNARSRCNPPLPTGYYGNAAAQASVVCTARELSENPLGYAVGLIQKAKAGITSDYLQSVADLMVLRGRPPWALTAGTYRVSDVRRVGFHEVDFGWGKPVYGGPAPDAREVLPQARSFIAFFRNGEGEDRGVVPVCLPSAAMKRFVVEIESMIKGSVVHFHKNQAIVRLSAL